MMLLSVKLVEEENELESCFLSCFKREKAERGKGWKSLSRGEHKGALGFSFGFLFSFFFLFLLMDKRDWAPVLGC